MSNTMQTTELGRTGTEVSSLCLGTMYFGSRVDESGSFSLMDRYVDAGGRFIDTANNYAFWIGDFTGNESETTIGKWLRERGNRDDIFLATKCGVRPVPGGRDGEFEGLSRRAIRGAIEGSLDRLGTDRIDLYYMHVDWRREALEETLGAFAELVDEGLVKHIGCSNMATWRVVVARELARRNGWPQFTAIQQWYSYLRPRYNADLWVQKFVDEELLDYIETERDLTILGYTATLGGLYRWNSIYEKNHPALGDRFHSEDNERRFAVLKEIAAARGVSPFQIVFAWMRRHDAPVIPVLGVTSLEQLNDNLASLDVSLTDDEYTKLRDAAFNRHGFDSDEEYSLF